MDEPTPLTDSSLAYPDFALHWAKRLGAKRDSLVSLHGGINNHVFSCEIGTKASERFVIKGYAPKLGLTDRMKAEVEFLRYAEQVAPHYIPKLLAEDYDQRCVVLEFIDGQSYCPGISPPEQAIIQAGDFFRLLNADKLLAKKYIQQSAADGFLSLTEHLHHVQGRLNQLLTDHLPKHLGAVAHTLLQQIRRDFDEVADRTKKLIDKGEVQDHIDPDNCCVSPSDFGFHNAFQCASGVKFFDFEFAGWDDVAKTMVDFILQPRVPVAPLLANLFYRYGIQLPCKALTDRTLVLGPILRIKWLCIMLSVLHPDRLQQMRTVLQGTIHMDFINQRLDAAQAYTQKEFSFGLH